jgi:hypothetical protein
MAEYRDLSTHKLQQLAQQRLREVPGLDPNDLGPFVVAEEMEYTHPEYYRERMLWIITAPAQELLGAMPDRIEVTRLSVGEIGRAHV